jgi:hypothetical protein
VFGDFEFVGAEHFFGSAASKLKDLCVEPTLIGWPKPAPFEKRKGCGTQGGGNFLGLEKDCPALPVVPLVMLGESRANG